MWEELCTLYTRQVGRVICLPYGVRAERVYEGIRLYREAPAADMERESIEITGEMLRAQKRKRWCLRCRMAGCTCGYVIFRGICRKSRKKHIRNGSIMVK